VFPVGVPPTTAAFDEAMYAPTTRLPVASAAAATRASTTAGAGTTGEGIGETHQALKYD